MGISRLGRTLIRNSCLASKLWYLSQQIPMMRKYRDKFTRAVDLYFRRGRRQCNVRKSTRILPKKHGGLGHIHIDSQVDLLQAKWVSRSLAATDHPWVHYL